MTAPYKGLPYALQHRAAGKPRQGHARVAGGLQARGVVIAVYPPGVVNTKRDAITAAATKSWVCDIALFEPTFRTTLYNVPIAIEQGGSSNFSARVPMAATQTIDGSPLVISPEGSPVTATIAENLDGDFVIVSFLADDLNQPYISGFLPHPRTTRTIDPTLVEQKYVQNTSFSIDQLGNVAVDLAISQAEITITMAGENLSTGRKVSIVKATGSNPEAVLMGQTYLQDYNSLLVDLTSAMTELAAAIAGLGGATPIISGTVIPNLANYQAQVGTALANGLPYLSSHLKVD